MDTVAYVMVVMLAAIALGILFLFISYDVKQMKQYKNANRSGGVILEWLGDEKVSAYGRSQTRKYNRYKVQFPTEYGVVTDELLVYGRKLEPGESIEVHYIVEQTGIHTVNEISSRRLKEFLIAGILGGIWAFAIIYYINRR